MKYLKLLEEYVKNVYYTEIDHEDFRKAVLYHEDEAGRDEEGDIDDELFFAEEGHINPDKCTDFTDYEFEKILKILSDWDDHFSIDNHWDINFFNGDKELHIIKGKDEWFYVKYDEYGDTEFLDYYKCDQFDGLLKLIKREILK